MIVVCDRNMLKSAQIVCFLQAKSDILKYSRCFSAFPCRNIVSLFACNIKRGPYFRKVLSALFFLG